MGFGVFAEFPCLGLVLAFAEFTVWVYFCLLSSGICWFCFRVCGFDVWFWTESWCLGVVGWDLRC